MKFLIKQFQKFKVLSQMHEKILQKKKKQDKRLVEKKNWHIQKKTAKTCRMWLMERPNSKMNSQNYRIIREHLTAILTNPAVGLHFEHMWFVNNQIVLYQGHVLSVKCSKRSNMPKVTVTYWKHDENQDEGDYVTT